MPTRIPDWVDDTPYPCEYDLIMTGTPGDGIQQVALDRDEFFTLKRHLAAMRGYTIAKAAPAVIELARELENMPLEKMAEYLGLAQALYERCPEAIASEAGLEAVLAALKSSPGAVTHGCRKAATGHRRRTEPAA